MKGRFTSAVLLAAIVTTPAIAQWKVSDEYSLQKAIAAVVFPTKSSHST